MTLTRITNSLTTRIIVLGVILLMLGNGLRYSVLSQYLREEITSVMASQQLTLANYVAREVDQKMQDRQAMLTQMAASLPLELLGQPKALQNWLAQRHQYQPLFTRGLVVSNPDGKAIIGFAQRDEDNWPDYGGEVLVHAAIADGLTTGRPQIDTSSQQAVLPMATPVKDATGTTRAVLVGVTALSAPGFLSFTDQDRIGRLGGFLLISPRDQLFIASTKPEMVLKPTPKPGVNLLHDRAMQGYRGSGTTVNAFGVEEISAIASVPSTGWFVVARLPTEEALSVVSRTKRFIAVNSVLAVLAFMLAAGLGLYYVFRPLLRAAQQADRMTRGEAPLQPLTVVRQDEVGHLTEAFNRLLTKLRASQSEMAHMAHHDVLTGLPNRALLADRLTQALARADRNKTRVALLCLDLDHFKPINDQMGHEAGDVALVEVARRMAAVVRESDTLARIGGDEFVVLLADLDTDPKVAEASAKAVATKCLEAIAPPMLLKSQTRSMGASIGIAMGDGTVSPHALQLAADSAMYQAKHAGGQRYVLAGSPYLLHTG
ncbi:GGDEF domain-containing protein [Rhodoferax sp. AJA081-3]|uniref:bifunctional diguanylate cyclase/phosphodiesterase n=1 Tax=Rhodoferax sp. AJA081-3 TaxID=2752316 RepID=UPI001BB78950|nr:diguanylate cyclase [Rhodoferax sp. AJA081-3]QTN28426.1 GGDEF domain-containing protein [Rhodoferax sp. AJA081-3]